MDIGFIGLGVMGAPMAGHLIKGGHKVRLSSRRGAPAGSKRVSSFSDRKL